MEWKNAKALMRGHCIGPDELSAVRSLLQIAPPDAGEIPRVPFDTRTLEEKKDDYLLILGVPRHADGSRLTLLSLRALFGTDPTRAEPCFYNQDWYQHERFASERTPERRWYLLRRSLYDDSRGKAPEDLLRSFSKKEMFPSAILAAFAFFANYFVTGGEVLWKHDFLWCSDTDANGDRIYVGRYEDPNGINKNGFNIHRHLSLKPSYGAAPVFTSP